MSDSHRRAGGVGRGRVRDRVECDCPCDCPATAWLNEPGKCQLCMSGYHANLPGTLTPPGRSIVMAVCACEECDCIITLEPTLPEGAICDWCESDRHGKPRSHTVESERAGVTIHAYPRNGLVVVETRRDAASVVNRVFLNRDSAKRLADQLDLAIIGGAR